MSTKFRLDHITRDASEQNFLQRQLEQVRAEAYLTKFEMFQARELMNIDNSIDPGAEEKTVWITEYVGQAELTSDYSTRGPRADVKRREAKFRIRGIKASYGYSMQEARNSIYSRGSLPQDKANSARRIIEARIEKTLMEGSLVAGVTGIANNPDVSTATLANGNWTTATPDEIMADLGTMVSTIRTATLRNHKPTTVALASNLYTKLMITPRSTLTNMSVLAWLQEQLKLTFIDVGYLEDTTAKLIMYDNSPMVVQGLIPQEFEQLPPQPEGFETVTQCHARCGGAAVYIPSAMLYAAPTL